jgi:hypothetical protein
MFLFPEGQMGEAWEPSKINDLSEIGEHWKNGLSLFLSLRV